MFCGERAIWFNMALIQVILKLNKSEPAGSLKRNLQTIKNEDTFHDFIILMVNILPKPYFDFCSPSTYFFSSKGSLDITLGGNENQ